jgi:hypothetical protein
VKQTDDALQLDWRGIIVEVTISYNWLNMDHHHIELRADQPLPVTTTGYRSLFLPIDECRRFKSLEEFLHHWLDTAARSSEWIKAEEERRQLKLF